MCRCNQMLPPWLRVYSMACHWQASQTASTLTVFIMWHPCVPGLATNHAQTHQQQYSIPVATSIAATLLWMLQPLPDS